MQQGKQKKSLFSQRIKQARQQSEKEQIQPLQSSFPKPINILSSFDEGSNKQEEGEAKETEGKGQKRFVQRLLEKALKKEEIAKIQDQNLKSVMAMSQEEVQRYQKMIMKELPAGLVNQLKEGKPGIQGKMKEQMGDENENNNEESIKMDNFQGAQGSDLGSLNKILFDIESHNVSYNYLDENPGGQSSTISILQLKHMIESENNQTQIVGSRLLCQLCRTLFAETESNKLIPICTISHQHFHIVWLAEDFHLSLLRSLIHQARKTRFKSCWMEMLMAVAFCSELIAGWLKKGTKTIESLQIADFLQCQLDRKSNFFMESEANGSSIQTLKANIIRAISILTQPVRPLNLDQVLELPKHPQLFLELVCLEEMVSIDAIKLHSISTLQEIATLLSAWKESFDSLKEVMIKFLYPITLEITTRQHRSNSMDKEVAVLKEIIYQWAARILKGDLMAQDWKKKEIKDQKEEALMFKCLHITRLLSPEKYCRLLADSQSSTSLTVSMERGDIADMLTLLNVDEYFRSGPTMESLEQRLSEIENIEHMLVFVAKKLQLTHDSYIKEVGAYLAVDLLVMFTASLNQPYEKQGQPQTPIAISYKDIKQEVLDRTWALLCASVVETGQEKRLWSMLPEQKIKLLIESYNYDSFGHYCFTRLLTFLAATCADKNTEEMIVEEVMARYPLLFYYAARQGLYGAPKIYLRGESTAQMAQLYQTIIFKREVEQDNLFLRYLLKK